MTFKQISWLTVIIFTVTYMLITSTSISLQAEIHKSDTGGKLALELKK